MSILLRSRIISIAYKKVLNFLYLFSNLRMLAIARINIVNPNASLHP